MAVLVFNGGHTLKVDGTRDETVDNLDSSAGLIKMAWTRLRSGDDDVVVKPHVVAYVVVDQDAEETFGRAAWLG